MITSKVYVSKFQAFAMLTKRSITDIVTRACLDTDECLIPIIDDARFLHAHLKDELLKSESRASYLANKVLKVVRKLFVKRPGSAQKTIAFVVRRPPDRLVEFHVAPDGAWE